MARAQVRRGVRGVHASVFTPSSFLPFFPAQQEFKLLGGGAEKFQAASELMFSLVALENHEIVNTGIPSLQIQASSRASFE